MGRVVKLALGLWSKSNTGDWSFEEDIREYAYFIVIKSSDSYDGVVEMIRIRLNLGILTPVALTYQLPQWMLQPEGSKTPLITLLTDKDVETMASVRDYMSEAVLYVTCGPEQVASISLHVASLLLSGIRLSYKKGLPKNNIMPA